MTTQTFAEGDGAAFLAALHGTTPRTKRGRAGAGGLAQKGTQ